MSEHKRLTEKLGQLWTDAVAYVALTIGSGLSIAGNVADTFRTRRDAVDSLDIVMAVAWPALVVLMVEIFVSRRWTGLAWPMQILRWVGTLAIGGMAMRVSWVHLNDLMASRGQAADVAMLGPLAIDALAIMATALILAGRRGHGAKDADKKLAKPFGHRDVTAMDVAMAKRQAELANEMAKVEMAKDTVEPLAMDVDSTLAKWDVGHTEHTPADWTGDVATPADMATSQMAMAGEIDSMAAWFDGAERAVDEMAKKVATEAEAYVASAPAPVVPNSLKVPAMEAARYAATGARESGYTLGQISELLGGHYGVSARTIRRQSWWPAVSGRPVSAPPAEGVN